MGLDEAASPHNEIVENEMGAKQSHIPARFDLLDGPAMYEMCVTLAEGAESHGAENWRGMTIEENLNHAMMHIFAYLSGNRSENHLSHLQCRAMFANAIEIQGGPISQKEPNTTSIYPFLCEWAGSCNKPANGYILDEGGSGEQHPLCWEHLNPKLHQESVHDKLYPNQPITKPCQDSKVRI